MGAKSFDEKSDLRVSRICEFSPCELLLFFFIKLLRRVTLLKQQLYKPSHSAEPSVHFLCKKAKPPLHDTKSSSPNR